MKTIHKVINDQIVKHGGVNARIAKKLSEHAVNPISPQLLGMYRRGERTPGSDFIVLWAKVFNENLADLVKHYETNVSHGTKKDEKHTDTRQPAINDYTHPEEKIILLNNLKQFGNTNAYLLKKVKELEVQLKKKRGG